MAQCCRPCSGRAPPAFLTRCTSSGRGEAHLPPIRHLGFRCPRFRRLHRGLRAMRLALPEGDHGDRCNSEARSHRDRGRLGKLKVPDRELSLTEKLIGEEQIESSLLTSNRIWLAWSTMTPSFPRQDASPGAPRLGTARRSGPRNRGGRAGGAGRALRIYHARTKR